MNYEHKNELQKITWLIKFIYGFAKFQRSPQSNQHNLALATVQPDCPEPSCFGAKEILNYYKQYRIALPRLFYYYRNASTGQFKLQYIIKNLSENPFVKKPCVHIQSVWTPSHNNFQLTKHDLVKKIPCDTPLPALITPTYPNSQNQSHGFSPFYKQSPPPSPSDKPNSWPLKHTKDSWNKLLKQINLPTQFDQHKTPKNNLFTNYLNTTDILLGLVVLALGYIFLFHKTPTKKIKNQKKYSKIAKEKKQKTTKKNNKKSKQYTTVNDNRQIETPSHRTSTKTHNEKLSQPKAKTPQKKKTKRRTIKNHYYHSWQRLVEHMIQRHRIIRLIQNARQNLFILYDTNIQTYTQFFNHEHLKEKTSLTLNSIFTSLQKEIAYFHQFEVVFKNGFNAILKKNSDAITSKKQRKLNAEDLKNDSFKRVRRLLRRSLNSKEPETSFIAQFNLAINESIAKLQPISKNKKLDDATASWITAQSFSPNRTPQENPQSPKPPTEQEHATITPKPASLIPTPTSLLTLFRPFFTQHNDIKKFVVHSLTPILLAKGAYYVKGRQVHFPQEAFNDLDLATFTHSMMQALTLTTMIEKTFNGHPEITCITLADQNQKYCNIKCCWKPPSEEQPLEEIVDITIHISTPLKDVINDSMTCYANGGLRQLHWHDKKLYVGPILIIADTANPTITPLTDNQRLYEAIHWYNTQNCFSLFPRYHKKLERIISSANIIEIKKTFSFIAKQVIKSRLCDPFSIQWLPRLALAIKTIALQEQQPTEENILSCLMDDHFKRCLNGNVVNAERIITLYCQSLWHSESHKAKPNQPQIPPPISAKTGMLTR